MPGQALAVVMGSQLAAKGMPSSLKTVCQTEGADLIKQEACIQIIQISEIEIT